ncbi:MAG: 3-phosphoshikimate 1-carboxyvinyltransferase [Immundisolibacteraceae bacterium]|nr:3-phosphoshikimate 1-carboxyvinyltransferase [Immundisolibacteraceae bacterium]
MSSRIRASGGGPVVGSVRVPGDKSISHRAVMFGALANGITEVEGFLPGADTLATLAAFEQLGVKIERISDKKLIIHGVGLQGLTESEQPLDMGNSGTGMRLMAGILAAQPFASTLIGDHSLTGRPMARVLNPLAQMGAKIESAEGQRPPLRFSPVDSLKAIDYSLPMASAQVKSCLLIAGLYADGVTRVTEPAPTRDHSERMLRGFGYQVTTNGSQVTLSGGGQLSGCRVQVPGDISSATFPMIAALITPGSELLIERVGINPTRDGVLRILAKMGARIEQSNLREEGGEPVADLRVFSSELKGIHIGGDLVALAIDEIPALAVAAACAEGTTTITDAAELRVKESDRITSTVSGLKLLGVDAEERADGMVIQGSPMHGGQVDAAGDHRLAMAFAIASLRAEGAVEILDCDNVVTSFPNFVALMSEIGLDLELINS